MAKTRLLILGSTGSIGRQTLEVVATEPEAFEVVGLTAYRNKKLLKEQAEKWGVKEWVVAGENEALIENTLADFVERVEADLVIVAVTGTAGFKPTLAAIRARRNVALANKEALVMGGEEIMAAVRKQGTELFPIDSEHSAIFQLLKKFPSHSEQSSREGEAPRGFAEWRGRRKPLPKVKKIILTCSGGPFWGKTLEELVHVTAKDALRHPTWSMGRKITIDSATWINKGFELIEAHHLFGFAYEDIEVVVHPQSIVHGMVKLQDGTTWFHASPPDMRIPIHAALHGMAPESCGRFEGDVVVGKLNEDLSAPVIPVSHMSNVTCQMFPPDTSPLYRGIEIALHAAKKGPAACTALVRADDEAVKSFLEGEIGFLDIYERLEAIFS